MAIVGVGRDQKKLDDLKKAIGETDRLITQSVDVMEDDAPKRIVDLAVNKWGHIDYLINNAGVGSPKAVHATDDAFLDYNLDLMLRAPFRLSREAMPHMPPGSAIIMISSTYAVVGGLSGGAYSAAKAGLLGLTTHIACQYGAQGLRCNAVSPGVIDTPMLEGRFENEAFLKLNKEMTPHTRLGTVEDCANAISFLCSEEGSFFNGQNFVLDGGWTSTKYMSPFALSSQWVAREPA
jgi:NAD(P)-dependent dehydrogenase (short-subunit alcohol dehydrogenase family)